MKFIIELEDYEIEGLKMNDGGLESDVIESIIDQIMEQIVELS